MTEEEVAREYGPELDAVLAALAVTDVPPRRSWPRLRLTVAVWPRRGLELADTPRPDCLRCRGVGGWEEHYPAAGGEYGGTDEVLCVCWDPGRRWLVLPLPRRQPRGGPPVDPWATPEQHPF
jgi:hypothetical protein